MEEPKRQERAANSAIALAVLTALGYVAAYAYERGYSGHFGVPAYISEVDIQSLVIALGGSISALMLLFVTLDIIVSFWPRDWPAGAQLAVRRVVVFALFIGVMGWLADLAPRSWLGVGSLVLAIVLLNLLLPLVTHRNEATYVGKLDAANRRELREIPRSGLLHFVERKTGANTVTLAILAMLGLAACFFLGLKEARTQTHFLVAELDTPCIVVTRTGDTLVCVGIETASNSLTGDVYFLPIAGMQFTLSEVGPFKATRTPQYVRAQGSP